VRKGILRQRSIFNSTFKQTYRRYPKSSSSRAPNFYLRVINTIANICIFSLLNVNSSPAQDMHSADKLQESQPKDQWFNEGARMFVDGIRPRLDGLYGVVVLTAPKRLH
jgi:hypothetical protein